MTKAITRIVAAFILASFFNIGGAHAQASLAAEDMIDEVQVVDQSGNELTFTLIRDAYRREQWYYVPNEPRLSERLVNNQAEPEFSLIRYAVRDVSDQQQIQEGGLLTFAATLAAPGVIDELRSFLEARYPEESEIRVAALPLKAAAVHIYDPTSGALVDGGAIGEGIAPTFASQKMVFSVPLTRAGADVYDALVSGTAGVPVFVEMTYEGVTPPSSLRVSVDLKRAYDHYSKDEKFRASASYYGLFGASYSGDWTTIRSTLIDEKIVTIEGVTGGDFDYSRMDALLQPILKRINDQILEFFSPPDSIDPAVAKEPSADGFFGSAGYSVAVKTVSIDQLSKETFDFSVRSRVERKTIASGLIGIGAYSDQIRRKLVTTVPPGPWQSVYFMAPGVGDDPELGLTQIDLQVNISTNGQQHDARTITWRPSTGWTDGRGDPRSSIAFPLVGSEEEIDFKVILQITRGNTLTTVERDLSSDVGERPLIPPVSLVEAIRVNGDNLDFARTSSSSNLVDVAVSLQLSDGTVVRGTLRPFNKDGVWLPPKPLIWLLDELDTEGPVIPTIVFHMKDGTSSAWQWNGTDVKENWPNLDFSLINPAQEQ